MLLDGHFGLLVTTTKLMQLYNKLILKCTLDLDAVTEVSGQQIATDWEHHRYDSVPLPRDAPAQKRVPTELT